MTGCEAKTGSGIAADASCRRRLCRRESLFAAGRARLAALGVAAFLILGSVAVGARSTAEAAPYDPVRVVALLNVQFLNDHADLEPTTNAERVRLASIESVFKAKLEASGQYKFVSIADRHLGRLKWADNAPTRVASGRSGVRAKATIPLRARSRLHRLETDLPNNRSEIEAPFM
jgi:hypothetical protein